MKGGSLCAQSFWMLRFSSSLPRLQTQHIFAVFWTVAAACMSHLVVVYGHVHLPRHVVREVDLVGGSRIATWCSLPWVRRIVALGVTICRVTCSDWWANNPPFSTSARSTYSMQSAMLVAVESLRKEGVNVRREEEWKDSWFARLPWTTPQGYEFSS